MEKLTKTQKFNRFSFILKLLKLNISLILVLQIYLISSPLKAQALIEPKDGRVYHGAQTMTYESGYDPLAGYLGTLNDSTIQPEVHGFFMASTDTLFQPVKVGDISKLKWDERFGYPGVSGEVYSMVTMGNDLYVGGRFSQAGDANLDSLHRGRGNIARWDGTRWHPLGSGLGGYVFALAVKDTVLYAAGHFSGSIAKWDGHSWSPVGGGLQSGLTQPVYTLKFIGSDLYVGGKFTTAGGIDAKYIAKWDGSSWSAVGNGVSNTLGSSCYVAALASIGQDLYAGGLFTHAGDVNSPGIARWDGSKWNAVDSGTSAAVLALAVMGNDLYAGGAFVQAGGIDVYGIAKWNGTQWSALGTGMNYDVTSLAVIENKLYAGGWFFDAGGVYASRVASWDGVQWSALNEGIYGNIGQLSPRVLALTSMGTDLFAGGYFTIAGSSGSSMVAKWSGSEWYSLGSGKGIIGDVKAFAINGSDVYAGGSFTLAGNAGANNIAKWDGIKWSALGDGVNYGGVDCLAFMGNDLFAGGMFDLAGGIEAQGLARWNGNQWSALPGDHTGASALLGIGSDLYVGGWRYVSIWNGVQWTDIADDADGSIYTFGKIGTDLYAAGWYSKIGGVNANSIARWNGTSWSPLGEGLTAKAPSGMTPGVVHSIVVIGTDVYVSGDFDMAGENNVIGFAKWDGSQWSFPGSGYFSFPPKCMAVIGNNLYFDQGLFGIYQWDGVEWTTLCPGLGNGFSASVLAMAASGNELWFGGVFPTIGNKVSASIAHCTGLTTFVDMEKTPTSEVVLEQNFPNPFIFNSTIRYHLTQPEVVSLKVYNSLGQLVLIPANGRKEMGTHEVLLNGMELPAGVYFYRLQTQKSSIEKKFIISK